MPDIGDNTNVGINLKWLIQIVVVSAVAVWGYFGLTSRLSQAEIDILRMKDSGEMTSKFRVNWPLGNVGALPDDSEQNMRLRYIERDLGVLEGHVDTLRILNSKTKSEEVHGG